MSDTSKSPIDQRLNEISSCLYRVSVKALIINDNKILLVKEWDDEWWSFPGGGIEHNESLQKALQREIQEELAILQKDIKIDNKIVHVGIGTIVEKLPMANLFFNVTIPINEIKPTRDVVKFGWFTYNELTSLLLVPTTTEENDLFTIINKQMSI